MSTNFPPTCRYALTSTKSLVRADGSMVTYLARRLVPAPESFALLQWHRVTQGERLDNVAAQYLGDPGQFWRLCDANRALRPQELTETIGRQLAITLPQGIPGVPSA
ncbi:MAG TPA: LysM domain-containing protein [Rhodanobacter sp.]